MKKRLAAVVTCVDSGPLAEEVLSYARKYFNPEITDLYLVDNGSYTPLPGYGADYLIRYESNIGANAVFHRILDSVIDGEIFSDKYEFVAFTHCDFAWMAQDWDKSICAAFDADMQLGLCGTIGSSEIDVLGGRGFGRFGGTSTSMIGGEFNTLWASPAEQHGKRTTQITAAAVLDHACMIFRMSCLKEITPQEGNFSPGHFYDRICSCNALELGWHIALLPIDCVHSSGGTGLAKAPGEHLGVKNRDQFYTAWLKEQGLSPNDNPDLAVYKEGERRFFAKYRYMLPLRVMPDYSLNIGWR